MAIRLAKEKGPRLRAPGERESEGRTPGEMEEAGAARPEKEGGRGCMPRPPVQPRAFQEPWGNSAIFLSQIGSMADADSVVRQILRIHAAAERAVDDDVVRQHERQPDAQDDRHAEQR